MHKIIKATNKEIPDIVLLNSFVQKIHYDKYPDIFKPVSDGSNIYRFFKSILEQENNFMFVAYIERAPAGYAWAAYQNKPELPLTYGRKLAYIHHIVVHEDYRRRNIGRALFNEIVDRAKEEGIDHFELDTWSFNTDAHKFFEQLGFETYNLRMWHRFSSG